MNFLTDPNIAFVLLVSGFVLATLALFAPGTGLVELGALFALALAAYSLASLPINVWALVILILGVIPFVLAMRKTRHWVFLLIGIAALVVGSIFVFRNPEGGLAVNPLLAGIVSLAAAAFLWLIGRKSLEAIGLKPVGNREAIIGKRGEARTDIYLEGTVYVGGEEWSARSRTRIPIGSLVRVVSRDGLILDVEPVSPEELAAG